VGYLPDFCAVRTILGLILFAQMLALVLTLADNSPSGDFWSRLGLSTLFIVWIVLPVAALLCLARSRLRRLQPLQAGLICLLVVEGAVVVVTAATLAFLPGYDATRHLPGNGPAHVYLRNLLIAGLLTSAGLRYLYMHEQWRRQLDAEGDARLAALQARMRPHFLFNSLNTIAGLIRMNPELAEELLLNLADMFRAILRQDAPLISLGEEVSLTRQYLNIENQRLGERLQVIWDIDRIPLDARIPPLSLQPLVENAIYHGIEPRAEGGIVEVHGQIRKRKLVLTVRNPYTSKIPAEARPGNRVALENLRLRLQRCFPDESRLLTSLVDDRYQVRIVLPYHRGRP
jgi:two-component system sensor histidine kinase AlgZ